MSRNPRQLRSLRAMASALFGMGAPRSDSDFFANAGPTRRVRHGAVEFDLPVRYYRDELFAVLVTANRGAVERLMPSPNLHPVVVGPRRVLLGVVALDYLETSIGPYGEVGIVVPVVHGSAPLPWVPGLFEGRYPGFGALVLHLPVTTRLARDAGRAQWGYTKFVADMRFEHSPTRHVCHLEDDGLSILTLTVPRRGRIASDHVPLVTYSVLDGALIRTTIPVRGVVRNLLLPRDARLHLGDHPVADEIRALEPGRILLARSYLERSAVLPAGEPVESGVSALDGYLGEDRDGHCEIRYA